MKKSVVAVAVLAVSLTACDRTGDDDGGLSQAPAKVFVQFDPVAASPTVPFPFDGFFAGFNDPTLNIPNAGNVPFVTQANLLDGFSTTASMFADFIGFVDCSTPRPASASSTPRPRRRACSCPASISPSSPPPCASRPACRARRCR